MVAVVLRLVPVTRLQSPESNMRHCKAFEWEKNRRRKKAAEPTKNGCLVSLARAWLLGAAASGESPVFGGFQLVKPPKDAPNSCLNGREGGRSRGSLGGTNTKLQKAQTTIPHSWMTSDGLQQTFVALLPPANHTHSSPSQAMPTAAT